MAHRELKDQVYAQFARIGKALARPQRLELLDLLAQGERPVEQLAHEAALSIANASQHLQVLRQARLVETRKSGLYVYYRLADPAVFALWRALRTVAERQYAEMDRLVQTYLHTPEQLEPISREELRARLASGNVLVLDVRPEVEYRQGHIAGARSLPVADLAAHLAELPRDREVVAYCRGPYCVFSYEAVQILAAHGFHARRLTDGFPEWSAAHLPVERAAAAS